jgi:hypothetical protein
MPTCFATRRGIVPVAVAAGGTPGGVRYAASGLNVGARKLDYGQAQGEQICRLFLGGGLAPSHCPYQGLRCRDAQELLILGGLEKPAAESQ